MSLPDKAGGLALSVGAFVSTLLTNDITTPVLGVGVSTIGGAVLGTYAAIAYDEGNRPRGRLFSLAIATVIIASAMTAVGPRVLGWVWANGVVEGGIAALAALACYYGIPEAIPALRRIIRGFRLADLHFFRRAPPDAPPAPDDIPTDGDPRR